VELSDKDRRQKVDRACRDAKKNSVKSAGRTAPSRGSSRVLPRVSSTMGHSNNCINLSSAWESRENSTNAEDGGICTQSSIPVRAQPPSPSASVAPVVVNPIFNTYNDNDNHNWNREPSQSPWMYRDNAPFLNTVADGAICTRPTTGTGTSTAFLHGKEQWQLQQMWSELHRTGHHSVRNEPIQGIQDDMNYSNRALRSSSATSEKVPAAPLIAPMLEYSCGSLVYDASSWGSDHNMDQTSSPPLPHGVTSPNHTLPPHHHHMAFPANAANSAIWGTNSISMDWNKSAVSTMDFSSESLDLLSVLGEGTESSSHDDPVVARTIPGKVGDGNHRSSLTLLDSSVSGTDLNGSYKPSVFFESNQVLTSVRRVQEERRSHRRDDSSDSDPNILQRPRPTGTLYQARYDYLKREESIDTAIAGNLKRYF
jgi:hypothetical protein